MKYQLLPIHPYSILNPNTMITVFDIGKMVTSLIFLISGLACSNILTFQRFQGTIGRIQIKVLKDRSCNLLLKVGLNPVGLSNDNVIRRLNEAGEVYNP